MSLYKCDECKDTGNILTESATISRPYMKDGKIFYNIVGHGNWQPTQCYCVGEEDECNA